VKREPVQQGPGIAEIKRGAPGGQLHFKDIAPEDNWLVPGAQRRHETAGKRQRKSPGRRALLPQDVSHEKTPGTPSASRARLLRLVGQPPEEVVEDTGEGFGRIENQMVVDARHGDQRGLGNGREHPVCQLLRHDG
jgi:hypothetical protein